MNKALSDELAEMGWSCEPLSPGYARMHGPVYNTILVLIDEVCEAEKDEFLRLFSNYPVKDLAATFWWRQWSREATMDNIENIEGSDEIYAKILEGLPARLRMAGMSADERLEGLSADERLEGLSADERLEGLSPGEVLEHFGQDAMLEQVDPTALARAIQALPEEERKAILAKLAEE